MSTFGVAVSLASPPVTTPTAAETATPAGPAITAALPSGSDAVPLRLVVFELLGVVGLLGLVLSTVVTALAGGPSHR